MYANIQAPQVPPQPPVKKIIIRKGLQDEEWDLVSVGLRRYIFFAQLKTTVRPWQYSHTFQTTRGSKADGLFPRPSPMRLFCLGKSFKWTPCDFA